MTMGWDDWDARAPEAAQRPTSRRPNWLAFAIMAGICVWVVGLVFGGIYAAHTGYPPLQFDNDPGYPEPTNLQDRVRAIWANLQMITLPVALLSFGLCFLAKRLRLERTSVVFAFMVSGLFVVAGVLLAFNGLADALLLN